jgi:hypothetical protein
MTSLLGSIRGTVQGVLGAANHVLCWVRWHTGGSDAARAAPERQTG